MPNLIWPLIMTAVCEQIGREAYVSYLCRSSNINKGKKEELMPKIYAFYDKPSLLIIVLRGKAVSTYRGHSKYIIQACNQFILNGSL